jgi:hypothetical protein
MRWEGRAERDCLTRDPRQTFLWLCALLLIRPPPHQLPEIPAGLRAKAENWLCQVAPSTKLLFLTQHSDSEIVRAALSNGAQGYLLKTDAGSELLPAIKANSSR